MKQDRHAAILRLIQEEAIETQTQLAERLSQRGIPVTQATVSRDIKDLRLVKAPDGKGGSRYVQNGEAQSGSITERLSYIFVNSVLSADYAGNIIVLRTLPGSANAAAEAVDSMDLPEVLGTMAGDNTIFIVVRESADAPTLTQRFRKSLNQ